MRGKFLFLLFFLFLSENSLFSRFYFDCYARLPADYIKLDNRVVFAFDLDWFPSTKGVLKAKSFPFSFYLNFNFLFFAGFLYSLGHRYIEDTGVVNLLDLSRYVISLKFFIFWFFFKFY